ncbi:MAG TPA: isoprenylcysteine carboxylmethyltransferase family protein [Pseudolabrys sp.]|nr:isoprenylcysteine carboxylmethyltransferase family protein [Pseudolabrys sp.]
MTNSNEIWNLIWSGWLAVWPTQLFALIWIGWLISWVAASFWSARTEKRPMTWAAGAYRIPIVIGGLLLTPWVAEAFGARPIWNVGIAGAYTLAGLTLAGVLFTWWARIHLGRLWSNAITRKQDHRVVDTGPYRFVRHPIYTGLIAAILATGAAVATVTALLGAALISLGLWQKARIEESFLIAELDPSAYRSYRSRVPMLIPFLSRH